MGGEDGSGGQHKEDTQHFISYQGVPREWGWCKDIASIIPKVDNDDATCCTHPLALEQKVCDA